MLEVGCSVLDVPGQRPALCHPGTLVAPTWPRFGLAEGLAGQRAGGSPVFVAGRVKVARSRSCLSRRYWGGVFFPMHYSVRAGLRKGIKTGKLKTGKWDVVLYSCLQSSCLPWFLGCGFAALCLLRLFAAENLSPPVPSDGTCPLHAGGVIDASLSGGCPPEFVVRRPGVSPPPPTNLPSKRWRDLILRIWRVDPLRCPSSLGGDLNSSFILHPSSFPPGLLRPGLPRNRAASRALPGRSAAAARLRSWRWGKTARKPANPAC
jgi:hypothetical protein